MEKKENRHKCPICGMEYTEEPAISRIDNFTQICPDCGTRQALESMGVGTHEQNHIIEVIHEVGAYEH